MNNDDYNSLIIENYVLSHKKTPILVYGKLFFKFANKHVLHPCIYINEILPFATVNTSKELL